MALTSSGITTGQTVLASQNIQYFNLFTGVMLDQNVTFANGLALTGSGALTGLLDMQWVTTPSAPSVSASRLYFKSNGSLYTVPNGGSEQLIGPNSAFGGALTVFLTGNVNLSNTSTFFNGPNTGGVGNVGQVWVISFTACMYDTTSLARLEARIVNSGAVSAYYDACAVSTAANDEVLLSGSVVVSLSATTIFTLQAKDQSTNNGVLLATPSGVAAANIATSISAWRLS